jgi:sporulation protein YlmC with PRC-barrel domain
MTGIKPTLSFGLGVALLIGATARAQEPVAADAGGRSDLGEIRKVSALLDTDVMNRANESIGEVEDIVLSPQGDVLYAILGHGGVAGVGEEYTAVPWSMLGARFVNGKWAANLDMTENALKQAPKFQRDNYQELTDPQWVARVRQFFGARPGQAGQPGREADTIRPVRYVLRASKIIGASLRGARNEEIGDVEDLLLDSKDRVAFAILGKGGVLDIGEDYVPVPWSALRLRYDPNDSSVTATINMTTEQLAKAPLVKGGDYATLLTPGFADQVYRYFGANQNGAGTGRATGNEPSGRP